MITITLISADGKLGDKLEFPSPLYVFSNSDTRAVIGFKTLKPGATPPDLSVFSEEDCEGASKALLLAYNYTTVHEIHAPHGYILTKGNAS